ncbi:DUF637 domain-containing protein, partial [Pseudomonas aeruginosa]|nr:DUF637 domain-containing protein [Pseudomonas aeruginosa]
AYGFKLIGDTTHGVLDDGSLGKIGLHALMGGLAAEAVGGDFRSGALAAGVNEALVDSLAKQYASLPIDDKKGLLIMSSQLIGVLAASTQGDADAKSLQTGAWVAGNATQYNYLEHSDVLAFAEDMKSCGKDEGCQKGKWEKERYNDESNLNVQEAKNTYGPLRAKEKRLQIAESLDTLMSVQCVTSRCESYKTELLGRSVDSYIHLSKVLDEWAPTLDRLALIGGAAAGKQIDSKVKRPGMPEPAELAQVQKAVDYLAGPKEIVKVNPPLALPPGKQGSVIRGSLTDHEFKQASEIVSFKGGEFKGVDSSKFAGIDGWLDGVPVQLKVVEGTSINAVRRNIVSGAKDMAKAGYRGDIYIDASRTGVSMNKMLDHFKPGSPVSNVVGEGVVSNVYIKTQDGWVNISAGRVAQHKGWQ